MLAPWYGPMALRRGRVATVAVMFLLGAAPTVLLAAPYYLTDLTYALSIGLMLLPLRHALLLGLGTVLGQIVWMRLAQGEVAWAQVAILVGVTAALGTVFALNFTIGHLRTARAVQEAGREQGTRTGRPGHARCSRSQPLHAGLRFVDPALAAEALAGGASPLTGREADVLRAASEGGTVADIARALRLSQGTVRNHLSSAIGKTRARTRAEAARLAENNGWL